MILYGLGPPKLAHGGIEHETSSTLRGGKEKSIKFENITIRYEKRPMYFKKKKKNHIHMPSNMIHQINIPYANNISYEKKKYQNEELIHTCTKQGKFPPSTNHLTTVGKMISHFQPLWLDKLFLRRFSLFNSRRLHDRLSRHRLRLCRI